MIKNRNFILLWLVSIFTTLGIELFTITILVTVFEQTGSTLQAAVASAARFLPAFVLGPVAGVLVDRFRRKNVLVGMDIIRAVLIFGAIGLLGSSGVLAIVPSYLILFGLSSGEVFHGPARLALIPSLVQQDELVRANSIIMVTRQVMMALSYTMGGWLVLYVPLRQLAIGIVVVFLLAIVCALMMVVPQRVEIEGGENSAEMTFLESLRSGWIYLSKHPIARPLTIMETVEHVPHGIWTSALILTFATVALNGTTAEWGYIATSYFSGMIIGSVAALALNDWLKRYPGRIIVVNACLSGFLTFAFASSPNVTFAVAMGLLFGPPFAIRDVAQDSLLQSTVAEGQLGRIYATRETLRSAVFVFAGLFFAWLSEYVPIRMIYVIGGGIYLLTGFYALSNKSLRESRMSAEPATS
ncbi:MAG: MFS transporter [Candidatus Promineifilaceae bacterium]